MSRKTRKLIWSAPLVAVLAVAGVLAMFVALAPNAVQAHDLPGAPMNLTGEAEGTRAINLDWNPPAVGGSPTSYRVDRSEDGNIWTTLKDDTGNANTAYRDSEVEEGEVWYYRVFAVNSAGTGTVSTDILVQADVATAPGSVRALRATVVDQNKIELTWQSPAGDGGADITHYQIHIGDDDETMGVASTGENYEATPPLREVGAADNDGIVVTDDTTTSYTHAKLRAGTRYVYQVYAVNSKGLSLNPGDSEGATTRALVKPGVPTGLTAVQTDADTFLLYWYAPANTGGGSSITYRVEATLDSTEADTDNSFAGYNTVTDDGTSQSTRSADFEFSLAGNDRAKFRVYSVSDPDPNDNGVDADPVLVSNRHSGEITVTVRENGARALLIPDAPTFENAANGDDGDATRDGFGGVDMEWAAPDIDPEGETGANDPPSIGGYRIDVSDDGVSWKQLVHNTRRTATEYHYNDPDRKERHYRIFAWHAQYLGQAQAIVVISELESGEQGMPGYVTGLTATPDGPAQIDLSWTKPAKEGNAPVTQYIIRGVLEVEDTFDVFPATAQVVADSDASGTLLYTTSKITSYSHEELSAGQTWKYQVVAVNDNGAGAIMEGEGTRALVRQATTPQESRPRAPEGLTAEDAKDSNLEGAESRGVLLLWNAPDAPAGAAIEKYVVERQVGMTGDWTRLEDQPTSAWTDYTDIEEPDADELRGYRVAAVSNNGVMGDWSNTAYYPHALAMHEAAVRTSPTDLTVTVTGTTVSFTWTDGSDTTGHTVGLVNLSDYTVPHEDTVANGVQMHEYTNVAPGRYMVAVLGTPWMSQYYDIEFIEVMSGN